MPDSIGPTVRVEISKASAAWLEGEAKLRRTTVAGVVDDFVMRYIVSEESMPLDADAMILALWAASRTGCHPSFVLTKAVICQLEDHIDEAYAWMRTQTPTRLV